MEDFGNCIRCKGIRTSPWSNLCNHCFYDRGWCRLCGKEKRCKDEGLTEDWGKCLKCRGQ